MYYGRRWGRDCARVYATLLVIAAVGCVSCVSNEADWWYIVHERSSCTVPTSTDVRWKNILIGAQKGFASGLWHAEETADYSFGNTRNGRIGSLCHVRDKHHLKITQLPGRDCQIGIL